MPNQLFYGDNLEVMRRHLKDESVDLVSPPKKRAAPLPLAPLICQQCGRVVMLAPSVIAKGRKYCSTHCYASATSRNANFVCIGCGRMNTAKPSQTAIKRYCSLECLKKHKKTRIVCEVCGDQRAVTPSVQKLGARFCSWQCARKVLNTPRPIMTCIQCGRERAVHPYRIRNGTKFCSYSCRSIHNLTHGAMASPTTIETMLYESLETLSVVYIKQHPIVEARTVPDAFIPTL